MNAGDEVGAVRERSKGDFHVSLHAKREMDAEGFRLSDVVAGLLSGAILEPYPDDQRGPSCLVNGVTAERRPIHIVCTTTEPLVIITVYEPKPPRWLTPTRRKGI